MELFRDFLSDPTICQRTISSVLVEADVTTGFVVPV